MKHAARPPLRLAGPQGAGLAGKAIVPIPGLIGQPSCSRRARARLASLKRLAAEEGIGLDATLAVGDGANDLDMIQAAGLGVAYRAKPVVAAQADAKIDHADLTALLYFQGYRADEFVTD